MNVRVGESPLYIRTKDGRGFKLSLDDAEKLRAFLEKRLYRNRSKKIKEVAS